MLWSILAACTSSLTTPPDVGPAPEVPPSLEVTVHARDVLGFGGGAALSGDDVWFGDGPNLLRFRGSTPPERVATFDGAMWLSSIAVADDDTVVVGVPGGGVLRVDDGSQPVRIAAASGPLCLAVDGDRVFFSGEIVRSAPLNGPPVAAPNGEVLGGGGCVVLAGTDQLAVLSLADGTLHLRPRDGGDDELVARVSASAVVDADATHVWWGDARAGAVFRRPLSGGPVERVLEGFDAVSDLDVHDGRVFVTTAGVFVEVLDLEAGTTTGKLVVEVPSGTDGMQIRGDGDRILLVSLGRALDEQSGTLRGRGAVSTTSIAGRPWLPLPLATQDEHPDRSHCFTWVHGADSSKDCYSSRKTCESQRRSMGDRAPIPCRPHDGPLACTTIDRGPTQRCFGTTRQCEAYREHVATSDIGATPCLVVGPDSTP